LQNQGFKAVVADNAGLADGVNCYKIVRYFMKCVKLSKQFNNNNKIHKLMSEIN